MTGKVFGIGLSRTGSASLAEALRLLGYRTAHIVEHKNALRGQTSWFHGDFLADCLADYDAAADLPIATYFPQLDERYPRSRFILTVRDLPSWLASAEQHWQRQFDDTNAVADYRRTLRLITFGIAGFSRSRFRFVYEAHTENVRRYFRARSHDLLVLDICNGEGWEQLCPFLNKPVPQLPFPCLNQTLAVTA